MAVASLAAILKPQIIRLMQGRREKELSLNQSGLLDLVLRHAAAMAQIKSRKHKPLQDKEAGKRIFPSLLPYFSLTSIFLYPPTTSIGSTSYTRCSERTDFCTRAVS